MMAAMRVLSSDGVEVAVHDLGGSGPTLLVSHATGFHGRCYIPVADALAHRYHSVAFDYRGHGDTPHPDQPVDWRGYGDDAVAMATALDPPVVAFGHSMGGACLLMAAHRDPGLFRAIVVFEPIVFPPTGIRPDGTPSPLSMGARRRRATFASYEAAIENYAAKPPLGAFAPAALDAYVRYGFAPGDDGEVHLKCRPEIEAGTFETGGLHDTWDVLPEIHTPVLVLCGAPAEMQPSMIARQVADRLPNSRYLERSDLDHFGPMVRPDVVADLVADFLAAH
jgi:pimeloyl-ACP methyl ester carboxylesterase